MEKEKPVAVYGAIASNLAVAVMKFGVAFVTRSSAVVMFEVFGWLKQLVLHEGSIERQLLSKSSDNVIVMSVGLLFVPKLRSPVCRE